MSSAASSSKGKSSSSRRKREGEGQLSFWDVAPSPAPEPAAPARERRRQAPAVPKIKVLDPEVSGLVGNEILEGRLQPAAWAMALASSSGSRDEAVSHYARLRLQSLSSENQFRKQKLAALESRRSSGFKKLTPEPPVPAKANQKRERLSLHPFWLAAMWLAVTGACSSAVRLFFSGSDRLIAHAGISPHIALGAALVCLAVAVHVVIPRARVLVRTLLPLATCAMAFASFSFGVLILKSSAFQDRQPPRATAAAVVVPVSGKNGKSSEEVLDKKFSSATDQSTSKALVTAP